MHVTMGSEETGQAHAAPASVIREIPFGPRAWPHNLPRPLTTFVGRGREVAEARRLLSTTRLLTLVGTAGVGKTRLAHRVAADLLDRSVSSEPELPDGVWLVELAALTDPALVPQAVATVLGVREQPERALPVSLAQALRPERLLLVLDNCEHLSDACAEIADVLLRACSGLRILATSRQPLGIVGETTFRVPPLAVSAPGGAPADTTRGLDDGGATMPRRPAPGPAALAPRSEAVSLFVERARAVASGFTLTDRNVAAVETICRRLDGIPLAIELAAARVPVLSPEQIAARLGDRFRLLSGGSRTALPRYRTLRALIDWSHDLLDEPERIVLRRLAVFSGGWTLDAAETVCAGDGLNSEEVLDLLSGLVAKSLVVTAEHDNAVRYRFLESLREYAAEKLRAADEETAARARHLDWCLGLAERAEPDLTGPRQATRLRQLDREYDNLRTALSWAIERDGVERGVRLAGALYRYWATRGFFGEGHRWLAELLARSEGAASPATAETRARALRAASRLAAKHGDHATAQEFLAEALAIARAYDDRPGLAASAHSLGCLARVRGDYEAALTHLQEARSLFEQLGDALGVADTLICLGIVTHSPSDPGAARSLYQESLATYRGLGNRQGMSVALNTLGEVALEQGELDEARSLEQESLSLASEVGDRERVAIALAALAGVAAGQGQAERAIRLAAAAMALREAMGKSSPAGWRARFERWLEPAHRALPEERARELWAEGEALSMEQAVACALAPDDPTADTVPPDSALGDAPPARARLRSIAPLGEPGTPAALSEREREVAGLVARGLTNRQIANELVIAEGTAANHVKHILARLGLDSRVQVAAWAIDNGLHLASRAPTSA